jgi:hypothetical protein
MQAVTVRPCAFVEIESAPNFRDLCAEYARESAIAELGEPTMNLVTYRAMEAAGFLHSVIALQGDTMVGFLTLILSELPHFSQRTASVESFFVTNSARSGGAGIRLRQQAELIAQEHGAVAIMLSAPEGSRLDAVLPRSGYRKTNHVYFRSLV